MAFAHMNAQQLWLLATQQEWGGPHNIPHIAKELGQLKVTGGWAVILGEGVATNGLPMLK